MELGNELLRPGQLAPTVFRLSSFLASRLLSLH